MALDTRDFRNALGRFATGICVVCTESTNANGTNQPVAMTVNSFASVSLEPALVLWSIDKHSSCFDYFTQSKGYSINVLSNEQQDLSARYAQSDHNMDETDYEQGKTATVVLKQALARFECTLEQQVDAGDHIILIGRVQHYDYQDDDEKSLIYFAGQYQQNTDL